MGYHKESLKEQLVEIAWEICVAESWQKVNMRRVAQKAGVSNTAFYRHFKNKNDLKAELMRRGFQILNEGMKDLTNNFSSYGAHYIRFGLDYPHIYDLMFGNTDLDMSLYPDLESSNMIHADLAQMNHQKELSLFLNLFTPSETTRRASISKPESVSSKIDITGSRSDICNISCFFFSPPE